MHKRSPLVASLLTMLVCTLGHAAGPRTPSWQLSASAGPYKPHLSDNADQRAHFDRYYGDTDQYTFEEGPMLQSLESTWYLWDQEGLLGVSTRIGLWTISGPAQRCLASAEGDPTAYAPCTSDNAHTGVPGATETQLKVLPLSVGVVYRANQLHQRLGIPLEAYVKGGLDYYVWWSTVGGEIATTDAGDDGTGGTSGYHLGAGINFNLDWLDPQTSRGHDYGTSLAGSYLFFEINEIVATSFGESGRMDMSATHYSVGISIDFR